MLLAGDIGGTKTALALYDRLDATRQPVAQAVFSSKDYASLEAIVAEFLAGRPIAIERASFGVAGPVVEGRVNVTNLPWVIDQAVLSQALGGVPVALLNDLEAIAQGVPFLGPADLDVIRPGQAEPGGTIAVIAPGTGLGEAFLVWDGQRYRPYASEGGHTDFGPTSEIEMGLLAYLQPRLGHVSYERVCSGSGLPNLYAYLRDSGRFPEPGWLRQQIATALDPTPVIVQAGVSGEAEICAATLNLFVSILGSEVGNLSLKVLATGGVYVGGGIPLRIPSLMHSPGFIQAFAAKGRFASLLNRVPVHMITNPQVALLGAAYHGLGS